MKLLYMSALAIMLASCSSDDSPTPNNSIEYPISLASVSLGSVTDFTRAGEGDNVSSSTPITDGSLGFYITKNGDKETDKYLCDNAEFTCENNTWTCDKTYYWASDDATIKYIAYYPYVETVDNSEDYGYNIPWDVSNQDADATLDLCYQSAEASNNTDHDIDIKLDHVCSKLVVNITNFGDEIGENPSVEGIKLGGLDTKKIFSFKYNDWASDPKEAVEFSMKSVGNNTFEAILIPQTNPVTLTVTVNGEEYIMNLPRQAFDKGTQYTLNIQVGQDITKAGAITRTPWIETVGGTITVE